CQQYSGYPLF
nr:immunoglobulin light chain junction region [Mus musculus]